MATVLKPGDSNVNYYLKYDGDKNTSTINIVKKNDQFTIILKDGEPGETENQLKSIEPLIGGIKPRKLSKNIYLVLGPKQESMSWVDSCMNAIRTKDPSVAASHVYSAVSDKRVVYYLTKKVILALKPEINESEAKKIVEQLSERHNLKLVNAYKTLPNTFLFELTAASKENPIKIANAIENEDPEHVDYAEPSLIRNNSSASHTAIHAKPKAKAKTKAKAKAKTGTPLISLDDSNRLKRKQWYLESVNVPGAWDKLQGKGDRNITIAIIDGFFKIDHPAFENQVTNKFDFAEPLTPFQTVLADHGTSCAGLIFSEGTSPLISGIAPGCSFIPVRLADVTSDDELLDAGEIIGPLVDIVSCSFGPDLPSDSHISITLERQISRLADRGGRMGTGILFCFSAGNFNLPINARVNQGDPFINGQGLNDQIDENRQIHSPYATHPKVMAIAACTKNNSKAGYSNYGDEISICAPGSDLLPFPVGNLSKRGASWIFTTAAINDVLFTSRFGGTSTSAPVVAGVAALVLSANKNLTAANVRQILEKSANKININEQDADGKYVTKNGDPAGARSKWFGYGKVDALEAVKMALAFK